MVIQKLTIAGIDVTRVYPNACEVVGLLLIGNRNDALDLIDIGLIDLPDIGGLLEDLRLDLDELLQILDGVLDPLDPITDPLDPILGDDGTIPGLPGLGG